MEKHILEFEKQIKELSIVLNKNTEGDERVSELINWCRKEYQKIPEIYIGDDAVVKTIKDAALKGLTLDFSLMEAYRGLKNNFVFADNRRANG